MSKVSTSSGSAKTAVVATLETSITTLPATKVKLTMIKPITSLGNAVFIARLPSPPPIPKVFVSAITSK